MSVLSRIALALLIIGGLNWGLIGFFQFDLVASLFGGQDAFLSRVVYGLVGISALVCIGLLFKPSEEIDTVVTSDRPSRISNQDLRTEFGEEPDFSKERDNELKKDNRNNDGL
ncbi:DUF378 domain-containing protein [Bhargavaea cecembensis]|uniref:DUF378 domain-containing protein n=1 Tax=Bhargavaea cecembensis TaxID=394098 RepID=A0A165GSZ4_9BACL|nr:DUF378 domain-containing protein [Bhargavaea cecembensis]KZE37545.1 DUF378 domain-containing protein [Bhargavaea cecembensis]